VSIPRSKIECQTLEARIQRRTGAAGLAKTVEFVLSDIDDVLSTLADGGKPSHGHVAAFRNSAAQLIGVLCARAEDEVRG